MLKTTLGRLPIYLSYLESIDENVEYISTNTISQDTGFGEVQVRKDLGSFSKEGRPKLGYKLKNLKKEIEECLGAKEKINVIIIGAGRLGSALMHYEGFEIFGINVIAGFDNNKKVIDEKNKIYNVNTLKNFVKKNDVRIAILTVPKESAKEVADLVVECKIKAIWNFTGVVFHLQDTIVENENVALDLANVNRKLIEKSMENKK